MLRFIYVIIMRMGSIIYFIPKMRRYIKRPHKYTPEDCDRLAKKMIRKVAKTSRIRTRVFGLEHLPKEAGYILYANHQSKFDALAIMEQHPRPCRVLMDMERAQMPLANEFVSLVQGRRLDKNDLRQQLVCFGEITQDVREGSVYLIFPEAGYTKDQTNQMHTFYAGCFRPALRSKCSVVPVALVDSYKTYGRNSLRRVEVQVHFLPPIPYEDHAKLTTRELADMVQEQIAEKIKGITGEDVRPISPEQADMVA